MALSLKSRKPYGVPLAAQCSHIAHVRRVHMKTLQIEMGKRGLGTTRFRF